MPSSIVSRQTVTSQQMEIWCLIYILVVSMRLGVVGSIRCWGTGEISRRVGGLSRKDTVTGCQ